jgi:hypothetical protein
MAATFVKYNPSLHPNDAIIDFIASQTTGSIRRAGKAAKPFAWSVNVHDEVIPGDKVFMALWSEAGFAGLLGVGTVVGKAHRDKTWRRDKVGARRLWYQPIQWTSMLWVHDALPAGMLLPSLPGEVWPSQTSGEVLPAFVADIVERAWLEHYRRTWITQCSRCGSQWVALWDEPERWGGLFETYNDDDDWVGRKCLKCADRWHEDSPTRAR